MRDNALFQQRTKPMKYFVSQPTLNPVSSMIWNAFQVAHLKIVSWSDQSHLLLGVLFAHFCSYDTDLMWQDEQKTTNNGEQNTQRELQCRDQLGLWMDRWLMCGLWAAEISDHIPDIEAGFPTFGIWTRACAVSPHHRMETGIHCN